MYKEEIPLLGLDMGSFMVKGVLLFQEGIRYAAHATAGDPIQAVGSCLSQLLDLSQGQQVSLGITGANAHLLGPQLGITPLLEIQALQEGMGYLNLQAQALLSLGHENMYYLELGPQGEITFFNRNSQCAAGSGAFWYQQATRMGYNDKELAEMAFTAPGEVRISGRCAVFAKSDMTHAINEGATQASVCAGMAQALAQMVLTSVAQNRLWEKDTLLITGGVAHNQAVMKYIEQECQAMGVKVERPNNQEYLGAIGAAVQGVLKYLKLSAIKKGEYVRKNTLPPLSAEGVHYLDPPPQEQDLDLSIIYLGVDCGSVSTKGVFLDGKGHYIGGVYLPTAGKPALQVLELMKAMKEKFQDTIQGARIVAATTGSGRFLSQKILQAEYAVDEITCQGEGVKHFFGSEGVLSIIEIGGEDSKFLQLREGILFDYNMNPVCAAGTGTFLENLSNLLGINIQEEFSQKAFTAEFAIDLGDTCTLLSQSALVSAASQGLPLPAQLASLAISSARNYLSRTVENRALEGKLIFTGATAKNAALASAFAAQCHQPVYIPPHPQLTGALGGARIARQFHQQGEKGDYTFRSLDNLQSFTVKQVKCKAQCEHDHSCTLDRITFGDGKQFLYGDRCNRYSGLDVRSRKTDLPDYKERRQTAFFQALSRPTGKTRVGVAQAGLFFDLYPFWSAFFQELELEVVLSSPSSETLLAEGKRVLETEMCYPMEVLVGHYQDLWQQDLDYLFIPEVVDMEPLPWAQNWPRGFTCSLLQTARGVVQSSLEIPDHRILYAQLNYRGGPKRITTQLEEMLQKLPSFSRKRIKGAVERGYEAQERYTHLLREEGEGMIGELQEAKEEVAVLFLGRSYTLYDDFIAKDSLQYARQRGLLAIPHDLLFAFLEGWYAKKQGVDFLPGEQETFQEEFSLFSNDLDNLYPIQLQRMISSIFWARFLNQRQEETRLPLFHFIIQDPFKCGPNAMLRHLLGNISPYLRLTLDEHTAPAGMITRLEAFGNTCSTPKKKSQKRVYSVKTRGVQDEDWKQILIPSPTYHSHIFAAIFQKNGLEALPIPQSQDQDLLLARQYVNGEECLPMIQNVQDFLHYVKENGNLPEESVFFQGWACGPCRYGLYASTQSLILHRAGYGPRRVCAVRVQDVMKRFGVKALMEVYHGLLALDLLYKMLHTTRPYEKKKGESEALFQQFCQELVDLLLKNRFHLFQVPSGNYLRPLEKFLGEAAQAFEGVPKREEVRPKIILAGEFYVRLDPRCNQDLIRKIEAAGGEVLLSPASEIFTYTSYINYQELVQAFQNHRVPSLFLQKQGHALLNWLAHRDERRLEMAAGGLLFGQEEPSPETIQALAEEYVSKHYGGEPPMTIGRTAAFARQQGIDGALFVAPFTCMPGSVVEAQMGVLREQLQIPIITIYYDGKENANREEFIQSFVYQARQKVASQGGQE